MAGKRYWAKRPFKYGELDLDRGQIMDLQGSPNDEKLVRLGYLAEFENHMKPHVTTCGDCGGDFLDHSLLYAHGESKHPRRERTPEQEDRFIERQDKLLGEVAPVGV